MINNKISSVTDYLLKMDELEKGKHKELLEKIEKLGRQLDIATNALKEYSLTKNWFVEGFVYYDVDAFEDEELAQKALKEIDFVGTSAKEEV